MRLRIVEIDSKVDRVVAMNFENLPVGALPAAVGASPLYMPENPPDRQNPRSLCNLVLTVSIGNKAISTTKPATPPDCNRTLRVKACMKIVIFCLQSTPT